MVAFAGEWKWEKQIMLQRQRETRVTLCSTNSTDRTDWSPKTYPTRPLDLTALIKVISETEWKLLLPLARKHKINLDSWLWSLWWRFLAVLASQWNTEEKSSLLTKICPLQREKWIISDAVTPSKYMYFRAAIFSTNVLRVGIMLESVFQVANHIVRSISNICGEKSVQACPIPPSWPWKFFIVCKMVKVTVL
jgi:hypothetical protein